MAYLIHAYPLYLAMDLSGVVTRAELVALAAEARVADARYQGTPGRLIDLTGVDDFQITFSDVFSAAKEREALVTDPFKTAVVVGSPVQRGFGRMYQAIVMHPKMSVELFGSREEAITWLEDCRRGSHSAAS